MEQQSFAQVQLRDGEGEAFIHPPTPDDYYIVQFPRRSGNIVPLFSVLGYWISLGSSRLIPVLSLAAFLLAMFLHGYFFLDGLNQKIGIIVYFAYYVAWGCCILNFMHIAFGDPGRNTKAIGLQEYMKHRGHFKCFKCLIPKGKSYHHCSECDLCTEDFAFHSKLYGNCIGRRNRLAYKLMPLLLATCILSAILPIIFMSRSPSIIQ